MLISKLLDFAMCVYSMSPVYYRECYFEDGPHIKTKKKRWPIVIAEMDEATRAKVSCDRTKDEAGFCDEAVEWHPPYGMGSSSTSVTDEMCPICKERLVQKKF
jgi:hypothetical protein